MENIVYTTQTCPFCVAAKDLLEKLGIGYEEKDLSDPDEMLKIKKLYDWRTVPIIVINGHFVGGYQELLKLHNAGDLDAFLKN